jgi:sugar lactone lactonase YvrE
MASSLVLSADGRRGAYVTTDPAGRGGVRVINHGDPGVDFDEVARGSLVISGDGARLAYAGRRGGEWYVVENDKESGPYAGVAASSLMFSRDGKRFAHAATRGRLWFVMSDGVKGRGYDAVAGDSLVFSPGGDRFAYVARRQGRAVLVLDAAELSSHDDLGRPVFSADGTRCAYVATDDGRQHVRLDGGQTLSPPAGAAIRSASLALSRDGKRAAYTAVSHNGARVIGSDGTAGEPFDFVFDGSLTFSPDGARIAYAARRGGGCVVVVDGKPGRPVHGVVPDSIAFSPDGRRLAYVAEHVSPGGGTRVERCVVVDGVEHPARFDRVPGAPRFSPDGGHVAYVAERIDGDAVRQFVVVDGTAGKSYAWVRGQPVFSPEGTRVAVMALGRDPRFAAGAELPRGAADPDAGLIVLDRSMRFRPAAAQARAERRHFTRAQADDVASLEPPLHIVLVQEVIGHE